MAAVQVQRPDDLTVGRTGTEATLRSSNAAACGVNEPQRDSRSDGARPHDLSEGDGAQAWPLTQAVLDLVDRVGERVRPSEHRPALDQQRGPDTVRTV